MFVNLDRGHVCLAEHSCPPPNLVANPLPLPLRAVAMTFQMDDFATPGVINAFGVRPSPANFVGPGTIRTTTQQQQQQQKQQQQ